jgi:hypothetical protein
VPSSLSLTWGKDLRDKKLLMKNLEYNGIGHSRIYDEWQAEKNYRLFFLRLLIVLTLLAALAFSK